MIATAHLEHRATAGLLAETGTAMIWLMLHDHVPDVPPEPLRQFANPVHDRDGELIDWRFRPPQLADPPDVQRDMAAFEAFRHWRASGRRNALSPTLRPSRCSWPGQIDMPTSPRCTCCPCIMPTSTLTRCLASAGRSRSFETTSNELAMAWGSSMPTAARSSGAFRPSTISHSPCLPISMPSFNWSSPS
jgi:hypothetical protein